MIYDELIKNVETFDNEELRDAAMKVLKKVPEKDWEEFDITGLDESEWVDKLAGFCMDWPKKAADRVDNMTEAEAYEFDKEMQDMRKRKRRMASD
jgi:hypothetical protein